MKIGIITQPLLGNYGGILQNYALQQVLMRLGHTPQTIDYVMTNSAWRYFRHSLKYKLRKLLGHLHKEEQAPSRLRTRNKVMEEFSKANINLSQPTTRYTADLVTQAGYEALVVGSDQVWRPRYNDSIEDMYLDFASNLNLKRVAYAASFGVDRWEYNTKQTLHCKALASKFDSISVREKSGEELCRSKLGVEATTVLDPTLLLNAEDYGQLCNHIPKTKEPILAVYILKSKKSKAKICDDFIQKIANKRGLKIKYFTSDTAKAMSVPEWLATFRDAEMVITNSFHGTVFSILHHREFLTLKDGCRGAARLNTLLGEVGLSDRFVEVESYDPQTISPINYEQTDNCLESLRQHSIKFLHDALQNK
jgi:hypothetical protein